MSTPADCNLLLGVLALQLDFVTREQLVAVVTGWLREKQTPLGQLLERQKVLTAARRQLLEALVDEHLRQHGGDVEQSLATLSSLGPVRDELQRLGDAELSMSLSRVAGGAVAARGDVALSDLPAALSSSNPGPRPETASEDRAPPRLRFRILRPHAEGGLGRVLVAHDEELHREVALKEIKPQFAMDVDSRNRFTLEAEVTGGLEHPGIVPVYGLGQYGDGRPYYAMRFIRGDSLKEAIEQFHAMPRAQIASLETAPTIVTAPTLIATEPAPRLVSSETFASVEFRKLLGRFIDVCQAIEYAHSRGVLHRDLKPGNIMLGKYGETLVVDWGLAKVAGKDDRFANIDESTLVPSSGSGIENTADGSVVGTPAYMSPEQAAGRLDQLGPATDVYSLGATLFHVLTGRSPFAKLPLPELLACVQRGDFPRPRELNSSIPKSLEAVCLKAMALLPEHRYESASAIAEDIEHWLADEPVNAHREGTLAQSSRWLRKHRAWAMSGAAALALVAVVSSVAALWINSERTAAVTAKNKETLAKDAEREQRKLAEIQQAAANRQNANHYWHQAANIRDSKDFNNLRVSHLFLRGAQSLAQISTNHITASDTLLLRFEVQAASYVDRNCVQTWVHDAPLTGAQFSRDESRVLTWSYDKTARLWNANQPKPIRTFQHDGRVLGAQFSRDESHVLTWSGDDKTARLWNVAQPEPIRMFQHDGRVWGAKFSRDESRVLTWSGDDETARLWDVAQPEPIRTFRHDRGVWGAQFNRDDSRVLTWSYYDKAARLWDVTQPEPIRTFQHDGGELGPQFSRDESRVLTWSSDTARLWDVTQTKPIRTFQHDGGVGGAHFSKDESRVLTWSRDNTARLWDVTQSEPLQTFKHDDRVRRAQFSRDESRVMTWSADNTARLWDVTKPEPLRTFKHEKAVAGAQFSENESRVLTWGDDTVRLWDVTRPEPIQIFRHNRFVSGAQFSRNNSRVLTWSDDNTARLWNVRQTEPLRTFESVNGAQLNNNNSRLLTWSHNTALLWDVTQSKPLRTFKHGNYVVGAQFNGNESRVLTWGNGLGTKIHEARLWDVTRSELLQTFKHDSSVSGAQFSRDESRLLTWSTDITTAYNNTARLWDVTQPEPIQTFQHNGKVNGAQFNRNNLRVLTWSDDNTVRLWDVARSESIRIFQHDSRVKGARFTPDESRVVTWSGDHENYKWKESYKWKTWLWDATKLEPLQIFKHDDEITGAEFSEDGSRLLTWSNDKNFVQLWNVTQPEPLQTVQHDDNIIGAQFSRDGSRFLTWSKDQTAQLWDVTMHEPIQTFKLDGGFRGAKFSRDESRVLTWGNDNAQLWDIRDPLEMLAPDERILELEVRSGTTLDANLKLRTLSFEEWQTKAKSPEYRAIEKKLAERPKAQVFEKPTVARENLPSE